MSNIDAVNALLTAINFDRFHEIEARHAPAAVFASFRGPILNSSVAIADWHREFLKDYADCNYGDLEYIEDGDVVAVRATIEAKGYDWRPFTQRVVEVFRVDGEEVVERRLYAMLRDIEFDKPTQQAMDDAKGYRGGSAPATRKLIESTLAASKAGDREALKACFHDKVAYLDGVYGAASGFDAMLALLESVPRPLFGEERMTSLVCGDHVALAEFAIDPARPRAADFIRIVDNKIRLIERYWMLREIGVRPDENYAQDRHTRKVIFPA
jgi:ketosteroid isomerase-like protein